MTNLNQLERDRFVAWLEQEASSDDGIVRQMVKIGMDEAIIKKLRVESMAARIIAAKLRSIHDETVG